MKRVTRNPAISLALVFVLVLLLMFLSSLPIGQAQDSPEQPVDGSLILAATQVVSLTASPTLTPTIQLTASPTVTPTLTPTPPPEIIVEVPKLVPPPVGDLCASGWYTYTNNRGQNAYLALNEQSSEKALKSGVWQPRLPAPGVYQVEAYIPDHGPIDWTCIGTQVVSDTSTANYIINSDFGLMSSNGDQTRLKNGWLSLGEYAFGAGTQGFVQLTNLTGEVPQSRTVSFSAVRFTWLRPLPKQIYMPVILYNERPYELTSTHTSDDSGIEKKAFVPGDNIQLHLSGKNYAGDALPVQVNWSIHDPCGANQVITDTVSLAAGDWDYYRTNIVPDCTGIFTYTVKVTYPQLTEALQDYFIVNYPSIVRFSDKHAFDACNSPSVEAMQTWWNSSPYYEANIYLGGVSFYCTNPDLDALWVNLVSRQGWSLIPTWVGPQAPCSTFIYRIHSDPNIAYVEGFLEADAAADAAAKLGLAHDRIIYYDVEGYSYANPSLQCRETMKTFIKGWVERLHQLGAKAGVYGGSCSSYVSDWATIDPSPDDVWIARWDYKDTTAYDVPCVSNDLWYQRRIRQYAGGHNETWGGVTINIDSNIEDGEVTSLPQPTPPARALLQAATGVETLSTSDIRDFQLISAQQGWLLNVDNLLWTEDGGLSWRTIAVPTQAGASILGATFLDDHQGWLFEWSDAVQVKAWQTVDGGRNWQLTGTIELPPAAADIPQVANLGFVDPMHGWIALDLPSGSSFRPGLLLATADGGATWVQRALPVGGQVRFLDGRHGWLAGGVEGNQLFETMDGGQSWQSLGLVLANGAPAVLEKAGLPQVDGERLWLPAVIQAGNGAQLALFNSQDAGQTWKLVDATPLEQDLPGGLFALHAGVEGTAAPATAWWNLLASQAKPSTSDKASGSAQPLTGIVQWEFSGKQNAWALVQNGECRGEKIPGGAPLETNNPWSCLLHTRLLKSIDGGLSWTEITPQ